jgi:hypothetical protein
MRKIFIFLLLFQFTNSVSAQLNGNIAVLPFYSYVSGSAPAQLDADEYELFESLLTEWARNHNEQNEYPYIQINLEQCYINYYAYIHMPHIHNLKFVRAWISTEIPQNSDWRRRASFNGDYFSVRINITEQSYKDEGFHPGSSISSLRSSNRNRIIYTVDTEEPYIYATVLNVIGGGWERALGVRIVSWNINRNIDLMSTFDIRRNAREMAVHIKRNIVSIDDNLLESFIENNSQFYSFNRRVNIIQGDIKWKWSGIFDQRSRITFSRAGFNSDKTQALIYVACHFGDFRYGEYYILEKEDEGWKIKSVLNAWIS